jgi:membrane associated rhomboid family serine protease
MKTPLFTVAFILANLLVYALEPASAGSAFFSHYGLVPAAFARTGDLTPVFTSLFLHNPETLAHIAGNMAFLAVFGSLVERELGAVRFAALYLAAGFAGGLLHVLVDPSSTTPLVGASGAVFGVLAVAGAVRPRLLGFAVAFAGVEIWHALAGGDAGVSFGAHLGGFAAGVLAVGALRATGSEALEAA